MRPGPHSENSPNPTTAVADNPATPERTPTMPTDRPARDATTTAGQRWLDELTRDARKCPDDHDTMKPVPNRRDRRRARRVGKN